MDQKGSVERFTFENGNVPNALWALVVHRDALIASEGRLGGKVSAHRHEPLPIRRDGRVNHLPNTLNLNLFAPPAARIGVNKRNKDLLARRLLPIFSLCYFFSLSRYLRPAVLAI
jgi:hypothetical protein